MTDNEIIKALECCTTKGAKCSDCPAFKKVDRSDCKKYFSGSLDLINRLQAQLADERAKIEICAETISRKDAEIERLKGIPVSPPKAHMDFCGVLCDYAEEFIDKAKTEAIKEFWGKLKKHSRKMQSSDFSGEFWDRAVLVEDGDNLVKEMVGEE